MSTKLTFHWTRDGWIELNIFKLILYSIQIHMFIGIFNVYSKYTKMKKDLSLKMIITFLKKSNVMKQLTVKN